MKLNRSLTIILLLTAFVTTSCSKNTAPPSSSSSAGALTANSAFNNLAPRPFSRQHLSATGFHILNEFIRPEIRSRMDEEPVGDSDGGYDPSTIDTGGAAEEVQPETQGEVPNEDSEPNQAGNEETGPVAGRLDSVKFAWAKKSFGDAINANVSANGVIVLYADENYYDLERLTGFVEQGRNRIVETSGVASERIQVVYGGYRSVPQVELWVIKAGEAMPEFKPEDRSKSNEPEN